MSTYRTNCFSHWRREDEQGVYLDCYLCGGKIRPQRGEKWEAEHVVRRSVGGSDDPSNVRPAHKDCHAPKTKVDISENAKGKRVSAKHFGIVEKKGWWKPEGYKHRWGR